MIEYVITIMFWCYTTSVDCPLIDIFRMADMSKIDPMIFQPFGAGPRNCIGMRLALLEMKFAFCKLLQKFKLELCEDTPVSKTNHSSILNTSLLNAKKL